MATRSPSHTQKSQKSWFRRLYTRGLAVILPTVVTIALLYLLFDFVNTYVARPIKIFLRWLLESVFAVHLAGEEDFITEIILTIVAFILALIVVAIIGLMFRGIFGKRLFESFENWMQQIPLVRSIYPGTKQMVEFFFKPGKPNFHAVVAIPYPYESVYSIAFVTSDGLKSLNESVQGKLVSVFIPASPLPMSGWIAFVPIEKVIRLPIHVDDALRLMLSAGLILPEQEKVNLGAQSLFGSKPNV